MFLVYSVHLKEVIRSSPHSRRRDYNKDKNTKRRRITGSHQKRKKKGGESEDNEWYLEAKEEEDFKEWEVTHATEMSMHFSQSLPGTY